jgi:cytochrome c-type biogenesis protein CcmE
MKPRHRRLALVVAGLCGVVAAVGLVLSAFNESLVFYVSPSQAVIGDAPASGSFRIGGLVEEGSLRRGPDGLTAYFTITDTVHRVPVVYAGLLPDLFKEGRGCVAQGTLGPDGVFRADLVLAKHDENYMPIEAAQSIERARRSSGGARKDVVDR